MKEYTINLIELAHMAQNRMPKYKELGKGVSFGMKTIPKLYEGTYLGLAMYINTKIINASTNAISNKELYEGCVFLYSHMLEIVLEKMRNE